MKALKVRNVLVCSAVVLLASSLMAEEVWIGRSFMPKANAEYRHGSRKLPATEIDVPITPTHVKEDWLWTGKAWVSKKQVVPVEDAAAYYTELLKKNPGDPWALLHRGET